MAKYVWHDGAWIEAPPRRAASGVTIQRDIPGYRSPIDGRWIDGRVARREDLARNNCREVDPGEWKPNPEYAARKARLKAEGR